MVSGSHCASFAGISFTIIALIVSLPLSAQTLYKCGKSFQDRPCETSAHGKAISTSASASQQPASPTHTVECVKRGEHAKKIVWARETGKTKEEQLATSASQDERDLIEEVYQMLGASGQISATVESRCEDRVKLTEEQARLVASLLAPNAKHKTDTSREPTIKQEDAAKVANDAVRENRCKHFADSLQNLQDTERKGGSAEYMDRLKERRRELEAQRLDAKC